MAHQVKSPPAYQVKSPPAMQETQEKTEKKKKKNRMCLYTHGGCMLMYGTNTIL